MSSATLFKALTRLPLLTVVMVSTIAQAQNPIQWNSGGRKGIAMAKQRQLPLMFFVSGSPKDNESDIHNAQQRSFADPIVVQIAREHFVPVLASRTSQNIPLLKELKLPTDYGMYVALMTPNGELLDEIGPTAVANAQTLADRMTSAFRTHRDQVFEANIKPVLDDVGAKPQALRAAMKQIQSMLILSADDSLVSLLKRDKLQQPVRKQILELLANLATESSVDALLKEAAGNPPVAKLLGRADVGAAEYLLPHLGDSDLERHLLAYKAVIDICKIGKPKARGFWTGKNDKAQANELSRVRSLAESTLDRWNASVGRYR